MARANNHSLLPWRTSGKDGYLHNAEGKTIADFRYKHGDFDLPLVCRAVNHHDSLLGALKEASAELDRLKVAFAYRLQGDVEPPSADVYGKVREAIAKAEEE